MTNRLLHVAHFMLDIANTYIYTRWKLSGHWPAPEAGDIQDSSAMRSTEEEWRIQIPASLGRAHLLVTGRRKARPLEIWKGILSKKRASLHDLLETKRVIDLASKCQTSLSHSNKGGYSQVWKFRHNPDHALHDMVETKGFNNEWRKSHKNLSH